MMAQKRKRVLFIGLDGFTWNLGRSFIDEGIMPNLAKYVNAGCHGILKSVLPYETGPAWSSFQTGCYPVKTGVFAFHGYTRPTRQIRLNSFNEIKVPTLWELLSQAGKKVISLNMPVTNPPPSVNGVIIPGFTCPRLDRETVYPPEIYDRYIKDNPDYLIIDNTVQETVSGYVSQFIKAEEHRFELAMKLMQDFDWDLFSIQMQSTDTFQHHNWWALDPSADGFTPEARKTAVQFYQHIDSIVGRLIEAAGESTITLIASDHGFRAKQWDIGINTWLLKNGYLCLNPEKQSSFKIAKEKLKRAIPPLKYLAGLYGKSKQAIAQWIASQDKDYKRNVRAKLYSEKVVRHIRETIDMDKSFAFCLGGMAGTLYLINQEQTQRADEMIKQLLLDHGPDSKEPCIESILPVVGEKTSQCDPDFIIRLLPGGEARINPEGGSVVVSGVVDGRQRGTHEQDGVFVWTGSDVGNVAFDAEIIDVAPTILAYLSVPVPDYMDGKVLRSVFTHPLDIKYETGDSVSKGQTDYSNADQSAVEKQLKDLGYL